MAEHHLALAQDALGRGDLDTHWHHVLSHAAQYHWECAQAALQRGDLDSYWSHMFRHDDAVRDAKEAGHASP